MNFTKKLVLIFLFFHGCISEPLSNKYDDAYKDTLKIEAEIEIMKQCQNDEDCLYVLENKPCEKAYCNLDINLCYITADPTKNGIACDDGNICTAGDRCQLGLCKGVGISCNDNNPCTDDFCTENFGCKNVNLNDGTECNDNNKCTINDLCLNGKCSGNKNICQCTKDEECAIIDDDLCDGIFYCNNDNSCENKPGTEIICEQPKDLPCKETVCVKETGNCAIIDIQNNTICDDLDFCTEGEKCFSGVCQGGISIENCCFKASECEDDDICTQNICDEIWHQCVFQTIDPCT